MLGKVTLLAAFGSAALVAVGEAANTTGLIPGADVAAAWTATGFLLWYSYHVTAKVLPDQRREFLAELRAERDAREHDRAAFQCSAQKQSSP